MGTKIGLRKPVENRGLDFSSALTYEFDASNNRIFQYVDLGSGLGVSMKNIHPLQIPIN